MIGIKLSGMLACLVYLMGTARAQPTAAAFFNMGGFTGRVTITSRGVSGIQANFANLALPQGSTEAYQARIHPYPVRTGERRPSSQCANTTIGDALVTWTAITAPQTTTAVQMTGRTGVLGATFVITKADSTVVACANIVEVASTSATETCGATAMYTTVRAIFNGAVAGEVILRQGPSASSRVTTSIANLFYTNAMPAATGLNYRVISGADCSSTPTVSQTFTSVLKIGTGAGGVDARTVSSESVTDAVSSYDGQSLEVLNGSARVACTPITTLSRRTFTASFGASGTVSFAQNGPYDSTEVKIALSAAPTGVNIRSYYLQGACSAAGNVFNPFDVPANTNAGGTLDMYPTGSITNKFTLAASLTRCDSTLTTFGVNSLALRTVDVTISGNQMCVNAEATTTLGESIIRSKAVFSSGAVRGTVSIRQLQPSNQDITTMFTTGLANANGAASMSHNWHVHVGRIGYQTDVAACAGTYAGGHYNPFGVFVNGSYSTECNTNNQLRCELGDTSKKSGTINMDNMPFTRQDSFMPMAGSQTILGRSFVIHVAGAGADRYACANIIPEDAYDVQLGIQSSILAQADFSAADFQTQVRASSADASSITVLYGQAYADTTSGCTYISAALQGTNAQSVAQGLSAANLGSKYSQNRNTCTTGVALSSASALTSTVYLTLLLAVVAIFM